MASTEPAAFKLNVLNPGGRDPEQYFETQTAPESGGHPPINFHAFAACTGGAFFREVNNALAEKPPILLLLRGHFKASQRALMQCKAEKRTVAVSLKESGLHQIAQQLSDCRRMARFFDIVTQADGCIATTPEAAEIYRRIRGKQDPKTVAFIPTPYPVEDRQWDLSIPPDKQGGILIGTREWEVPSRNHFAALLLARQLCEMTGESVTVFNLDGRKGRRWLSGLKYPHGKLQVIEKEKGYADYLREVGKHKIVLQLDRSRVPGQVAGDALLCRNVCVGGDGTIERIAFPSSCGEGRTSDSLGAIAIELIKDTSGRATAVMESQWRALERLSFQAVRPQLANFFAQIGPS
jgi:hypothetical protein